MKRRDEYEARAQRMGMPFVDLTSFRLSRATATHLSKAMALSHRILPIREDRDVLFVAVGELDTVAQLPALFPHVECDVKAVLAVPEDLLAAIERVYGEPDEELKP